MEEIIKDYCKILKIGRTFYRDYKDIEAQSHEEFLLKLLERELALRETTRKKRLLASAGFDVLKTFQSYSFEHIEIPKSISLESLWVANFVQNKENLILYGPVGTGKTHLATAIGVEACNQGKNVNFSALQHSLISSQKPKLLEV